MKKIIGTIILLMSGLVAVNAQPVLAVGIRGIYSTSAGSSIENGFKTIWDNAVYTNPNLGPSFSSDLKAKAEGGGGFALFAKVPLGKRLGAQIEFGWTYQKVGLQFIVEHPKYGKFDENDSISFNTMNLPFMLTFDIVQTKNFILAPMAGLYIAKPVGKTSGFVEATINSTALFGAIFGGSATVRLGKVGLVADIRYNIGFNSLIADNTKLFTPRSLQISGGLAILMN